MKKGVKAAQTGYGVGALITTREMIADDLFLEIPKKYGLKQRSPH